MPKIKLSAKRADRLVSKPTKKDQTHWSVLLPGFGLRCRPEGARNYVAGGRFGGQHFKPLDLGDARILRFEDAEQKAREWLAADAAGLDPRDIEAARKREESRKLGNTVANVAETFLVEAVVGDNPDKPKQRQWKEVKRQITMLVDKFGKRPIHDITRDEIIRFVKDKRSKPAEARNLLGRTKAMFGWAQNQDYGLERNVATDIKASAIIGKRVVRERVLSVDEVRQVWRAASKMPYPNGPMYKLLILTGLRLNECAGACWSEIDTEAKTWSIPGARMKTGLPHVVPLTDHMLDVLGSLPRFVGDHIFSTDGGHKPIHPSTHEKRKIDAELQIPAWQNHDLRRAIRTKLAELGVADPVAEMVLAHKQGGIKGVYNKHQYLEERRAALEQWGNEVNPPSNITPMRRARRA
jgi:integrase